MNLLDKEWRIHVCHGEYRFLVKGMPTFVSREQADELEWLFFPFEPALRWGLSELTKILFDIHDYLTEGNVVRAFPKRRRFTPTLRAYVLHNLKRALATGALVLERIEPIPIDAFSAPVFFDHREPGPPPAPKPEVPTTLFELQVVDGFGRPLEGLPVIFSVGGSPRTIDTDAEGMARLEGQQTSFASVRIEDVQAIQDKLDAFGEPPPGAEAPPESADVSVHMFSLSSFPSISLEDKTKHILVIREPVVRVRLMGMFFDEAKAFLLPSAMNGIQTLVDVYNEHPKAKLLVVGHTDREGKIEDNAELSLERAKSIAAYLRDDVDHWFSFYEESVPKKKRWDSQEDRYMLSSLPFGSSDPYLRPGQSFTKAVREFQMEHGLTVDGIAGPQTRRALISDYMALDWTTVPEGTETVTHGCGEHFPAITTEDGEEEPDNRRVEIFVFPRKIQPEPPEELSEEGSTEHPQWVEQVEKNIDIISSEILGEKLTSTHPLISLMGVAQIFTEARFCLWMVQFFGYDIPVEIYKELYQDLRNGKISMPPIQVVFGGLGGHVAAYSSFSRTIKVDRLLIRQAEIEIEAAWQLFIALFEEFGHHIDHILRNDYQSKEGKTIGGDARLDEGVKFAYSIINPQYDVRDSDVFAEYHRDGEIVPLSIFWGSYKEAIDRWKPISALFDDDRQKYHEFFEAGLGHEPDDGFGHERIEDEALQVFNELKDKELRREIYFGNWLRDHSQVIDTAALNTLGLSRTTLTNIIEILAVKEFEVENLGHGLSETTLGVYRPEEHIDNPFGYDPQGRESDGLRSKTTALETGIDPILQMKNYIRAPGPFMTSARYMTEQLEKAISHGPTRRGRMHLGNALHTLEDFYAHSNFVELMLTELGHPVVTWTAKVTMLGKTFEPVVTGMFGMLDAFASFAFVVGQHLEVAEPCKPKDPTTSEQIFLELIRGINPSSRIQHLIDQAAALQQWVRDLEPKFQILADIRCATVGKLKKLLQSILGTSVLILANEFDLVQNEMLNDPNSTDPTHTQLSKDHADHPLHPIAADCAKFAVTHVAGEMLRIWESKTSDTDVIKVALSFLAHPALISPSFPVVELRKKIDAWAKQNPTNVKKASSKEFLQQHVDNALAEIRNQANSLIGEIGENVNVVRDWMGDLFG